MGGDAGGGRQRRWGGRGGCGWGCGDGCVCLCVVWEWKFIDICSNLFLPCPLPLGWTPLHAACCVWSVEGGPTIDTLLQVREGEKERGRGRESPYSLHIRVGDVAFQRSHFFSFSLSLFHSHTHIFYAVWGRSQQERGPRYAAAARGGCVW